jgi:uncharacterized protein with HEPN domain
MSDERLIRLLEQLRQAAGDACAYVEGLSREDFFADKRTQQAVVLNLLIIGEIAGKLMQEHVNFIEAHPRIPWRGMKGMRNRIAHGYFEIDMAVVWDTVRIAVPDLLRHLP